MYVRECLKTSCCFLLRDLPVSALDKEALTRVAMVFSAQIRFLGSTSTLYVADKPLCSAIAVVFHAKKQQKDLIALKQPAHSYN